MCQTSTTAAPRRTLVEMELNLPKSTPKTCRFCGGPGSIPASEVKPVHASRNVPNTYNSGAGQNAGRDGTQPSTKQTQNLPLLWRAGFHPGLRSPTCARWSLCARYLLWWQWVARWSRWNSTFHKAHPKPAVFLEGRVPSRPAESSLCTLVVMCHVPTTVALGSPLVEMELDLP